MLRIVGARVHNLKNIDVEIPLGMMVAITGVSGSGKSTLVHDVLFRSIEALHKARDAAAKRRPRTLPASSDAGPRMACRKMEGAERICEHGDDRSVAHRPHAALQSGDLHQGVRRHSRPVRLHSRGEQARLHAGHFSFNIPGGRCETCQGDGTVTVEMQFLADVELICEECKGTRYKSAILDIRYNGLNIHEVLATDGERGDRVLPRRAAPGASACSVLDDVGLGYLRLGQSATTLSGGEAQRVKLAAHLAAASCRGTLFIFDEPTTGLHFDDIAKLLAAFERLIENGGSLVVIEHNLDVIRAADWVIDLGPEGGAAGGRSGGGRNAGDRGARRPLLHRPLSRCLAAEVESYWEVRMRLLLLVSLAGPLALIAAEPLAIVQPVISQMEEGAASPPGFYYAPGEVLFFTCRVAHYAKTAELKVRIAYSVEAFDPKGVELTETYKNEFNDEVSIEDKDWMPKIQTQVMIPPLAGSGAYKIVVKAEDEIAKTTAQIEVPFEVHGRLVEPSDTVTVRNFRFYHDESGKQPAEKAVYHAGQTMWTRFDVIGYHTAPATRSTSVTWRPSCCPTARCCGHSRSRPPSRASRFIPSDTSPASSASTCKPALNQARISSACW